MLLFNGLCAVCPYMLQVQTGGLGVEVKEADVEEVCRVVAVAVAQVG